MPLHFIVSAEQSVENVNKLRILLSADKESANAINKESFTPLMIAGT